MPTALIAPLISGGASIIGSLIGGNASKKAAQQLVDSQNKVIQNTNAAVETGKSDIISTTGQANEGLTESQRKQLELFAPYLAAGSDSLSSLQQLSGAGGPLDKQFSFGAKDLQDDPGYQFTLAEGKKAIERAAAAKGGLFSGATLKSLTGYATGASSTHFNDAFQRAASTFDLNRTNALSRIGSLQNLAQLGYTGTAASGQAVANTEGQKATNLVNQGRGTADIGLRGSETIGRALTGQGTAQASGTVGQANAWQGAVGGVSRSIQDFLTQRKAQNSGFKPGYINPGGEG